MVAPRHLLHQILERRSPQRGLLLSRPHPHLGFDQVTLRDPQRRRGTALSFGAEDGIKSQHLRDRVKEIQASGEPLFPRRSSWVICRV